jgi:hypothetical protein
MFSVYSQFLPSFTNKLKNLDKKTVEYAKKQSALMNRVFGIDTSKVDPEFTGLIYKLSNYSKREIRSQFSTNGGLFPSILMNKNNEDPSSRINNIALTKSLVFDSNSIELTSLSVTDLHGSTHILPISNKFPQK